MQKPVIQLGEHLSWGRAGLDCGAGVGRAQGEVNLHHPTPHLSPQLPFLLLGRTQPSMSVLPACPRRVTPHEVAAVAHKEEGNLLLLLGVSAQCDTRWNSLPRGVCSGPSRFKRDFKNH